MSTENPATVKKGRGRPSKEPPPGTVGARIRERRMDLGIDPDEMARRVGLTNNKMISYGELHSNFSDAVLINLARELRDDFGLAWLREYAHPKTKIDLIDLPPGIVDLPLVSRVSAGGFSDFEIPGEVVAVPQWMLPKNRPCQTVVVQGDSMRDGGVFHGDILIITPTVEPENHDIVVIEIKEQGATVKEWMWIKRRSTFELVPRNPDYPKGEPLKVGQIRRVHEVIGVLRAIR
jgi:SOS-response transcriptional repressor LexA